MVDGYSVKRTREQAKIEAREEAKKEMEEKMKQANITKALKLINRGLDIKDVAEDMELSITDIENEIERLKKKQTF